MGAFVYLGPLDSDSPLFRGRQKELAQLLRLCSGAEQGYAIVYGGRQTGKTSLLMRLATQIPIPVCACYINYQGTAFTTISQVLHNLAQHVSQESAVELLSQINTVTDLEIFFHRAVECIAPKRLILLLDEMGALPSDLRHGFANVIRAIYTKRAWPSYRSLNQLTFVLAGGLELHELATAPDVEVSPLSNVCARIFPTDLSRTEAVNLITDGLAQSGISRGDDRSLGETVYAQVAGHPYLTQRLGGMVEEQLTGGASPTFALEQSIRELRISDAFLLHLHRKVERLALESACQMLLEADVAFTRHDEAMVRLEMIGLVRQEQDRWIARNPLLKDEMQNWFAASVSPGLSQNLAQSQQKNRKAASRNVLKTSIVRIYAHAGPPIGAGFLFDSRYIFTCAHVAAAALGMTEHILEVPQGEIWLDWPLIAPGDQRAARVVGWHPSGPNDRGDIAVLDLIDPPLSGTNPISLAFSNDLWGHECQIFGFPEGHDGRGVWALAELRDENLAGGWLQINSKDGYPVEPGFSGSPVWDETLQGVVGMVVAAEVGTAVKAAFIIPSARLREVWPMDENNGT